MNALHHACQKGKEKLVDFFLEHKDDYDVFAKDDNGKICADYIDGKNSEALLRKLKSLAFEHGLDPGRYHINAPGELPSKQPTLRCATGSNESIDENIDEDNDDLDTETRTICNQGEDAIEPLKLSPRAGVNAEQGEKETCNEDAQAVPNSTVAETKRSTLFTKKLRCNQHFIRTNGDSDHPKSAKALGNGERGSNGKTSGCKKQETMMREGAMMRESRTVDSEFNKKQKSRKTSKELLVKIFKIYEKQNSELYREGAMEKPVENEIEKEATTPVSGRHQDILIGDIQRIPSGRASRSMSLVPSSLPSINTMKKRRSSRVLLQYNKPLQKNFSDMQHRPNTLQQRRFSSITTGTFTINHSKVGLDNSPFKGISAQRAEQDFFATSQSKSTQEENESISTLLEKASSRNRNNHQKVSSLPSLQAFEETGEQKESVGSPKEYVA